MNTRPSLFESVPNNRDTWIEDRAPDPSLFLSWAAQDQLLKSATYIMENTEDVVLLIGPHGAGKTTLIYRIQGQAQDNWLLCRVDSNPMLHPDQLLQSLARRIGLNFTTPSYQDDPVSQEDQTEVNRVQTGYDIETNLPVALGETALAEVLHSSFGNLRLQGKLPIVLIDDADQLPTSTLRSLLRLHERTVEGLSPFALVLLAEPTIDITLASRQARQPSIAGRSNFQRLEVPPLAVEQMDDYIDHFCRTEDIKTTPRWSKEQLTQIHQETEGLPGKINDIIKRWLRGEAIAQNPSIGRRIIWLFLGISTVGALGFGMLQFPFSTNILTNWFHEVAKQASQPSWISKSLPLPTPSVQTATTSQPHVGGAKPNTSAQDSSSSSIPDALIVKPLPLPAQPSQEVSDTTSSTTPPAATNAAVGTKRNEWALQQPTTDYTLQLTTASSEVRAQRYLAHRNIQDRGFYVEIQRGNKQMYYILYGSYPTRAEANAALTQIPSSVRKKAFPLALGKLQSELRSSQ